MDPFETVVNVLLDPIPLISDLVGHDVTLADLAEDFFGGTNLHEVLDFLDGLTNVAELANSIKLSGGQLFVDMGDFRLDFRSSRPGCLDINGC